MMVNNTKFVTVMRPLSRVAAHNFRSATLLVYWVHKRSIINPAKKIKIILIIMALILLSRQERLETQIQNWERLEIENYLPILIQMGDRNGLE